MLNIEHRFGKIRFSNLHLIIIGYLILIIRDREHLFILKDLWFYIPLVIITAGLLNKTYKSIVNGIRIFLNKKLFKRRFVVESEGIITFSNYKKTFPKSIDLSKHIIGVVCEGSMYIDTHYEKFYLLGKNNTVKYYSGLQTFIEENDFINMEDLDKKLVIYRLGVG